MTVRRVGYQYVAPLARPLSPCSINDLSNREPLSCLPARLLRFRRRLSPSQGDQSHARPAGAHRSVHGRERLARWLTTLTFVAFRAAHPEQDGGRSRPSAFRWKAGIETGITCRSFRATVASGIRASTSPNWRPAPSRKRWTQAGLDAEDVGAWVVVVLRSRPAGHRRAGEGVLHAARATPQPGPVIHGACGGFAISCRSPARCSRRNPTCKHVVVAHTDAVSPHLYNQGDYVRPTCSATAPPRVVQPRVSWPSTARGFAQSTRPRTRASWGTSASTCGASFTTRRRGEEARRSGADRQRQSSAGRRGRDREAVTWFVPHQTGNGIVDKTARMLKLDDARVFKDVQRDFGNISGRHGPGRTCGACAARRADPRHGVLGATAGAGGEMGAFVYRVPAASGVPLAPRPAGGQTGDADGRHR